MNISPFLHITVKELFLFLSKQVGILCVFCFITVICTWPAAVHISDSVIGDGGDNYEVLSYVYLAKQNILSGRFPLSHTDTFRYPVGFNLSSGSDQHLFIYVASVLSFLISEIPAFNVTVLFFITINGVVSFYVFSKLFSSQRLGLVGGILYGYSYYVLSKAGGHMNIMQVYGFPLVAYFVYRLWHKWALRSVIGLFIGLLLVALSSVQYFAIVISSLIVLMPLVCIFHFNEVISKISHISFRDMYRFICVLCTFLIAFSYLFYGHVELYLKEFTHATFSNETNRFTDITRINLISYLVPSPYLQTFFSIFASKILNGLNWATTNAYANSISGSVFLGLVEIMIFIYFLVLPKNRGSWFLLSSFIVFFSICLGDNPYFPYAYLKVVPIFNIVGETERFFVVHYLFLTLLVLKSLSGGKGKFVVWFVVTCLLILERITTNFFLSPIPVKSYQEVVQKIPGTAVLDIPILDWPLVEYNLLPFFYNKKIVGGYFQWFGDREKEKSLIQSEVFRPLRCQSDAPLIDAVELVDTLQKNDIQIIVLHKDFIYYDKQCDTFRLNIQTLLGNESGKGSPSLVGYNPMIDINAQKLPMRINKVYSDADASVYEVR